jgi:hypothetical protein
MKKSILSLLLLLVAGFVNQATAQEIIQGAAIEFEEEVHNYGNVPFEGNGTFAFVFKNTGTEPLIISNAKGSCGCTVPTWPQEPIAPGKTAKIDVTYDTKRVGEINKSVTIMSNAVNEPVKVVRITGTVLPQPVEEGAPAVPPAVEKVEVPALEIAPKLEETTEVVQLTKAEIKAQAKAAKAQAKAEKKAAKEKAKADKQAAKNAAADKVNG